MTESSVDAPPTREASIARLYALKSPGLDDLKLMVLLEAAGQSFYDMLAAAAPTEAIRQVFARNGREEMAHAHRVIRVIKRLHGVDVTVPAPEDNPYCDQSYRMGGDSSVTKTLLDNIVQSEIGGEGLYEGWASNMDDEEAARLLRLNGKEERRHGERIQEVIGLLPAA